MGNESSNTLSQAEIGRRPTDNEMMVLLQLQRKLFTRLVQSPEHLGLLKRYWNSHFVNKNKAPAFEMVSPFWCTEGGFTSERPGEDLRCMGELGLQCLVFFAEKYPGEARMMKRAKGGYPFVKAAMAVARSLCEALYLVDEQGERGKFPVAETLFWQILEREESFYKLFSLSFLLFEQLYCEELARDRTLPVTVQIPTSVVASLVDATKAKLLGKLKQAPTSLDDLRTICPNANQILDGKDVTTGATVMSTNRTRASSLPAIFAAETDTSASWKQRQTMRKSMKSIARSWSAKETIPEDQPLYTGVAPRLVPRQPEIALKGISRVDETDLFAGLVTKPATTGVAPAAS